MALIFFNMGGGASGADHHPEVARLLICPTHFLSDSFKKWGFLQLPETETPRDSRSGTEQWWLSPHIYRTVSSVSMPHIWIYSDGIKI